MCLQRFQLPNSFLSPGRRRRRRGDELNYCEQKRTPAPSAAPLPYLIRGHRKPIMWRLIIGGTKWDNGNSQRDRTEAKWGSGSMGIIISRRSIFIYPEKRHNAWFIFTGFSQRGLRLDSDLRPRRPSGAHVIIYLLIIVWPIKSLFLCHKQSKKDTFNSENRSRSRKTFDFFCP